MVDETQCPAHQCGIACTNCGVVRECDCQCTKAQLINEVNPLPHPLDFPTLILTALKRWQEDQDANPLY